MKLGMQPYIDEISDEFEMGADSAIIYGVMALCRNCHFLGHLTRRVKDDLL